MKARLLLFLLCAIPAPAALRAQALTLGEALARADEHAWANRMARGEVTTRAGTADGALRGILPTLRVEGGWVKTTDPLAAFGTLLRQRAVTQAAFDPARLNDPAAIANVSGAVVVEQPLFNADAWLGRKAAARATDAARAAESWTRTGTSLNVVRAYYGAILAGEQVAALEAGHRAAAEHRRLAETMHRNELVTRSDMLLASVRAGGVEADLAGARGDHRLARVRLALVMGTPADTAFRLPHQLPDTAAILRLARSPYADEVTPPRGDVRAAARALEAARADVARAWSLYLPRVNGFGRLEWNTPDSPFSGSEAWTVGVMVSWSPFAGGSELAERRAARGRQASAEAGYEAARAQAELERQQAESDLDVALARMAIAARSVVQAGEAHRIVTRRYEGGLATAVELFDAAAQETRARLASAAARYSAIVAVAERDRASGRDLSSLATLDTPGD